MKDFKRIVQGFNIFESREYIRQIDAAIIMISLSFGTAVVILPYSINQLGIVGFVLTLWIAILILLYSSVTVTASCSMLNTEKCDYETLRDPFPFLAELAYGKSFRKVLVVIMYICNISMAISFLLVSATILSDLIKIDIISKMNDIRITVLVSIILASPLMYIGLYKDLVSTAYMAVITSVIAMAFIFGDSISAHKLYSNGTFHYSDYLTNISSDTMFSQYGVLIFALSGPVFVLPNVFIYVEEKGQLQKTVVFTHIVIYFLYTLCAFVPYLLFQGQVLPSITETISNVAKYHQVSIVFRLIVITVQLLVSCHLILVSVLIMNPIYQMFESYIDIPQEFNFKRLVSRTCFMVCIAFTCLLLPDFQTMLSLVGGVPITILGSVFPLMIYIKLTKPSKINVFVSVVFILFSVGMMIGNFVIVSKRFVGLLKNFGNLHDSK